MRRGAISTILLSFLIAIFLTLLPLPSGWNWFKPAWVLVALIYWVMRKPYQINIGFAWFMGIIMDVLNGSLLGEHALAYAVATYMIVSRHSQFRMYHALQQSIYIFIVVIMYLFLLYCVQSSIGATPSSWFYWTPAFTSMILWLIVMLFNKDYHRKLNLT